MEICKLVECMTKEELQAAVVDKDETGKDVYIVNISK
jgi:hypothetical protein